LNISQTHTRFIQQSEPEQSRELVVPKWHYPGARVSPLNQAI
jgi:hypothetical protein